MAFLCFKTCLILISEGGIEEFNLNCLIRHPKFLWMNVQHNFNSTLSTLAHLYNIEKKLFFKFLLINSEFLSYFLRTYCSLLI